MSNATGTPGESKACTGCGTVKPLTDFSFDKRRADGRQARCKACYNAYKKVYRERDREHYLELRRLEQQRRKPQIRAYREANKERIRQQARDRIAALTGEELESFQQMRREVSAAYLNRNPEACAERISAWKKSNRDKVLDSFHRRRARQMGNAEPEKFSRQEIGDRDGWICGICKTAVDQSLKWPDHYSPSVDHIIPLVHGGPHTRANVRITHVICNIRRGAGRPTPQDDAPSSAA